MIKSVKQGVNRYKKKLREYAKWFNPIKETYGDIEATHFSDQNWRWYHELEIMEEILALTTEEIKEIGEECGVARKEWLDRMKSPVRN